MGNVRLIVVIENKEIEDLPAIKSKLTAITSQNADFKIVSFEYTEG